MAKSEVYNTDCIEYMRTLPDGHFDIAVCDPPYGSANDDALIGGGAKTIPQRRMLREVSQSGTGSKEDGENATTRRFQGGTWATKYKVPMGGGYFRSPNMGCCTATRVL